MCLDVLRTDSCVKGDFIEHIEGKTDFTLLAFRALRRNSALWPQIEALHLRGEAVEKERTGSENRYCIHCGQPYPSYFFMHLAVCHTVDRANAKPCIHPYLM